MDTIDLVRDAELRALALLDEEMPDVLHRLVRLAASITGASGARINVISSTAQHTLVNAGGEPETASLQESVCARILREPVRSHRVSDARTDPRLLDSDFVTSGVVTAYAAEHLVTSRGVPIGTLCVYDPSPMSFDDQAMSRLTELAGAVVDVMENRRLSDNLRDSLAELTAGSRELRRSNQHLAAFAGQVSHDVQGPLAAVLMALQLMEEDGEQGDPDGFLISSALSGAQRMRATIAGLMDFAVLGGTLSPQRLDMNTVVAEVLVDLSTRRGRADVHVADLPPVWGSDVQVRAVTQNFVANALKYAGSRPVIHIDGEVDRHSTRITISDDGPGVPPEEREAIFALNVRGQGVELTGVDGLGIGLATCRRIIDAHGGRIGVAESATGGAAFWFELPNGEL